MSGKRYRNGSIASLKFLFCICIIILHCFIPFGTDGGIFFEGAYILVDFFFMIAGYYMLNTIQNEGDSLFGSLKYGINRIKRFFPWVFVESVLMAVGYFLLHHTFGEMIRAVCKLVIDSTFILSILPKSIFFNGTLWFLSASLVSGVLINYLLREYKEKFIAFSPFIGLGIYNYMIIKFSSLDVWWQMGMICQFSIIRAFAGFSLGCFCRRLVTIINQIHLDKKYVLISRLCGGVLLGGIFSIILFRPHRWCDSLCIIAFIILIIIANLNENIISGDVFDFLDRITLPMYVFQMGCINFVNLVMARSWKSVIAAIVLDAMFSTVIVVCAEQIHLKRIKENT